MNKSRIEKKLVLKNETLGRLNGGLRFRLNKGKEDPCTWNSSCPSSACESVQNDTCPDDFRLRRKF
jgi:hypothetical protein